MAPNLLGTSTLFVPETNSGEPVQIINKSNVQQDLLPQIKSPLPQYRWQIVWRNILIFLFLHISAFYGIYYLIAISRHMLITFSWGFFVGSASAIGVTAGAHRLWAHRTYKAKLPLRILLAFLQTIALQNDVYEWVRDHRVHHKFTDTDADPHNAKRGFFFSHIGWLCVKKNKEVFSKGKTVDMSDLKNDPIIMFQRKYYLILAPLCSWVIPAFVPWYFWNEHYLVCINSVAFLRYMITLHATWLVNSAAHIWGTKPYDKNIRSTENISIAILTHGEGWHNYHHVFPWDYKAAELGAYRANSTTLFLDFMAKIGWAYDLKTVSQDLINKRAKRTGDGSRICGNIDEDDEDNHHEDAIWGWGDKDMKEEDINLVEIHHKKSL